MQVAPLTLSLPAYQSRSAMTEIEPKLIVHVLCCDMMTVGGLPKYLAVAKSGSKLADFISTVNPTDCDKHITVEHSKLSADRLMTCH